MGHELGHILLPWHLPSANCAVGDGALDLPRFSIEDEADVFASCLLVPDAWLLERKNRHGDDMSALLQELNAANVSTEAAVQALRRYLLAGWVFVSYGGTRVLQTRGTNLPNYDSSDDINHYLKGNCHSSGTAELNGYPVEWYKMVSSAELPARSSLDSRSDHQILLDAISMVESDDDARIFVAQSANGKVGGALREAQGRPATETFEVLRYRCEHWPYSRLLEQPDFLLWLAQRARAVESGDTKRGRASRFGK